MKKELCDICKKNFPDAKIKYKYKAKKTGWNRIEICQECLDKIVSVDQSLQVIDNYKEETIKFIKQLCIYHGLITGNRYIDTVHYMPGRFRDSCEREY